MQPEPARSARHAVRVGGLGLLLLLLISPVVAADQARWVLVDTGALVLQVMRGEQVERIFTDIAIGRFGTTTSKRHRDNKTPLGTFHIVRIARDSPFRLFLGLDYPDLGHARQAHDAGWLSEKDWRAIQRSARTHREPPQNTPLGGYIGIHGLGEGDPEIHRQYNWTNGCIALTNGQIAELGRLVRIGTRVVIR